MIVPPPPPPPGRFKSQSFALSKETRQVGNITLRYEGFGSAEMDEISGYVKSIYDKVPTIIHDDKLGQRWFGSYWSRAKERIAIVDKYIRSHCTSLTFVRKISGAKCDNAMVEINDYGQVIPTVFVNEKGQKGKIDYHKPDAHLQTQSGLRIFISPFFKKSNDPFERLNCIYHEITHKVIDTSDFEYGPKKCAALAKANDKSVIANADNYGYWLAEGATA